MGQRQKMDALFAAPMLFIYGPVQQGGENLEHNFNVHLQRLLPLHQVTTALLVSVTGCFLSSLLSAQLHQFNKLCTLYGQTCCQHLLLQFVYSFSKFWFCLILLHGSLFNHPTFSREIKLSSLLWSLLRMTPSPPTVHEVKKIRSQGSMAQSLTGYWVPSKKNSLFT